MKSIIIALALVSTSAFAAEIILRPGTSAVLRVDVPTRVTCENISSGDNGKAECRIQVDNIGSVRYQLVVSDRVVEEDTDPAVIAEKLKDFRAIGICR